VDDPFVERLRRALAPDFEVERPLGAGGMGIVLLARERSLGRQVAIKTIKPEFATAVAVERFLREAQTLASLSHPNIVPIYALQQRDGIPCIVMEYLEGETLRSRIERGPVPPDEARRILRDVLAALEAAHARGVVHRDVKPDNIFLRPDRAVLTDFGIAKPVAAMGEVLTVDGQVVGTRAYMAPERFATGDPQPASDIYAVGMVLYEALTGRPWTQEISDPVAGDWTRVPRDLVSPLQRALAFAPSARWVDAGSFRRALKSRGGPTWLPWAAAVAAVIAVGAVWRIYHEHAPAIPDVVLTPFAVALPGDSTAGDGLTVIVGEILRRFPRLSLVPVDAMMAAVRAGRSPPPALHVVRGELRVRNGVRELVLGVRDTTNTLVGRRTVPDTAGGPWDFGHAIALAIIDIVKPSVTQSVEGCRPSRVDALERWLEGEAAFRRDDWAHATLLFQEAMSADPEFCIPPFRLWLVQVWARTPVTVNLDHLLSQHGTRLPEEDRLMIEAALASTWRERYERYQQAVDANPFAAYAPLQYGADLMHRGPLAGIPLDSSLAMLQAALVRDSSLAPAHDQLMWALTRLGYRDAARAALQALTANARASRDVDPSVFELIWAMRFQPVDSVLPRLGTAGEGAQSQIAQRVRLALSFDLAPYQAMIGVQLAARPDVSAGMRAHGRIAAGVALLALGRPVAGLAQLDAAVAMAPPSGDLLALQAAQWRVLAASLGIPGVPDQDVTAARTSLELLSRDSAFGGRAAWALALDAWHQGDTTAARALVARIPPQGSALRAIATAVGRGRGDPRQALALTAPWRGVREEGSRLGEPFARAILHLRRAEWYEATGEPDLAERERRWHENSDFEGWLEGPIQSAEVDWVAGAYVRVREGMRRLEASDLTACADLRRVVDTLWTDAEPAVASVRDAGRAKATSCR